MELLVLVFAAGLVLWIVAIVDLIGASEMEPVGRLILAGLLLVAAPIGILVWLVVRQGRLGAVLAMLVVAVGVAVVAGVISSASGHSGAVHETHVQMVEIGGASGTLGGPGTP